MSELMLKHVLPKDNDKYKDNCPFTIVTAFMTQINARGDRPVKKYIDLGKSLLALHIPQIVFIERYIYDTYLRAEYRHLGLEDGCRIRFLAYGGRAYEYIVLGHLTFVFFERNDMYLEEYREMATEFALNTSHPAKDTLDYMFVQCHKTEWVAMATCLDSDNGDGIYAWLDFGLRHMYPSSIAFEVAVYGFRDRMIRGLRYSRRNDDRSFVGELCYSRTNDDRSFVGGLSVDSVFAPSCWDAKRTYSYDVYRDIFWVFSGSAFCGKPNTLLEFARRTKSKCIEILSVRRRLMWEVNVWYLVYCDCPALFSLFYGNHNATILGGTTFPPNPPP
jgi:hypothetical protein